LSKKSFTLFEVLLSLIILSIVVSGISRLYIDNDITENYYTLQKMENEFVTTGEVTNTTNIKITNY
jgi:type II secretory pathway component PulJ